MLGRSNSSRQPLRPNPRLFAVMLVAGLALAVVAISGLLELHGRMLAALSTLETINALQAGRASTTAYLMDGRNAATGDANSIGGAPLLGDRSIIEALVELETAVKSQRDLEPFVDKYVDAARADLSTSKSAPFDPTSAAAARRSGEELDAALRERAVERHAALLQNSSSIVLAVAALIAAVALAALSQGWELLATARREFTTRSDSATTIESLSNTLGQSREALDALNRRLNLAMRSAHVVAFSVDASGNVTWSNDAASGVFGGSATPFLLSDLAPEAERARIQKCVIDASLSGDVVEFEMRVERGDHDLRWVKVTLLPVYAEGASERLGSVADVTDMKRREEGNVLLMRELSHRSKNLLAIVQAMARQTAQKAGSPVEFYERFGARLRALAAGHDLLVKTIYTSAEFGELIRTQIGALASLIGSRVFTQGPLVHLRPEATQTLGMALHELATNAQIHGAMTNSRGRLDIGWRLEGSGPSGRLIVDWVESDGPNVAPSDRRGFGSTLILENLPRSLHGIVTLDCHPEGARCHMDLPFKYTLESFKPDESGREHLENSSA